MRVVVVSQRDALFKNCAMFLSQPFHVVDCRAKRSLATLWCEMYPTISNSAEIPDNYSDLDLGALCEFSGCSVPALQI